MTCIYLMSKHWKQPKTKIVIILRWICIYLMSNRSKMLSYVSMHSKQHKTTKVIKLQWLASIWCQNILNYKSDQNAKLQRLASISCQTDQNNSKLQKRSNYNELHRFDVKTIKNVALRRKTFKTTQNYKSNQITTICIDLTSKRSKILSYVAKHSKQRKKRKWSKYNYLHRLDVEKIKNVALSRKTFKTTQNYKSDQNTMNLHRLDVKTIKNVALSRKTFKTTQNYKSDHITMNLHRFDVKTIKMLSYVAKHSKQHLTTKVIKLQWLASIWCQKHQNNEKLQTRSNYNELHRFDVITIKNVELGRKTIKTTQNYKSDHITMNLHRFHVKTIKTTQNYKNDQITMNCIDLTS